MLAGHSAHSLDRACERNPEQRGVMSRPLGKLAHLGGCPTRETSSSSENGKRDEVFPEEAARCPEKERLGSGARRARREVGGAPERRKEGLGPRRWRNGAQPSPTALTSATAPAPAPEAASGQWHRDAPPTFSWTPRHAPPFVALVTSRWPIRALLRRHRSPFGLRFP